MTPLHVGDAGTVIEYTATDGTRVEDVSVASSKTVVLLRPDGTRITVNLRLSTDGLDGKMYYVITTDDTKVSGELKIQAFAVLPSGQWHSDITTINVIRNI